MASSDKVRENRLRRMADRQGLALRKRRRRDPRALDYGLYDLIEPTEKWAVAEAMTIDEVEAWLTNPVEQRE
jgi:hypothetical protein